MSIDLTALNNEQIKPVLDTEGAVLVTAGAGSGKTRLLTHRIAHIVEDLGVAPYRILAITFTNKAAGEMRERLQKMLDERSASQLWVFTFHALCLRILRRYVKLLGGNYDERFSVYGETEKEHLIKRILKDMQEEADVVKDVICAISDAKNKGLSPDEYKKQYGWRDGIDLIVKVYYEYEKELTRSNALDFDDLLNKTFELLKNHAEPREFYQEKFKYIHVDEFQDTNKVQYNLIKILGAKHGNVFAVGDEDQSIYGWRGAVFANIFDFTRDYTGCKIYKLEQNYRSTSKILEVANRVIKINKTRLEKKLWTENGDGENVVTYAAKTDGEEADFVVRTIYSLVSQGSKFSDFAILMRINSLSRSFEERFLQYGIPHRLYGGFKFYDRKEIKDMLAYLKIMGNKHDEDAILRVINFPKRGIGDGSVGQLVNYAKLNGISLYDVIINLEKNEDLPKALIKKVLPFTTVMQCMENAVKQTDSIYELIKYVVKLIDLKSYYAEETEENEARKSNIRELIASIKQFEETNETATLEDYLQQISLYSDLDEMDGTDDCVTIATVHSAKGLEFKNVFVVGLEEGIFPSSRTVDESGDIEEERRLMYVAVTRAMKRLYLTYAQSRFRFGKRDACIPSQFLEEAGFVVKRRESEPSAYQNYSGRYDSYRGTRQYSSSTSSYEREEQPLYSDGYSKVSSAPKPEPQRATIATVTHKNPDDFKVGTRVKHAKFGEGTVVKLEEKGRIYIEVKFDKAGNMMLLLEYAPIEPI